MVNLPKPTRHMYLVFTSDCFFFPGGVILYAGSSGSASPSPGSPSSGYQTQSPSTHSQPSSPEEVTFTEIGALKQHGSNGTPSSPKLVFQFPEIYSSSTASSNQNTYSHPIAGKRPCGFTGTFTSKHQIPPFSKIRHLVITMINQFLFFPPNLFSSVPFFQKQEVWSYSVKCAVTSHQVSIMEFMRVRAAR